MYCDYAGRSGNCSLCRYKMFLYIFQGIFTTRESSELRCLGQKAPEAVPGPQAELPQL